MDFNTRVITYGDLRRGLRIDNDEYGIAYYEYESRRKTFLSNPCVSEDEDSYMYLVEAEGIPVGRAMYFDTRLKIGEKIVPLHTGSALQVEDSFQKYGLGGEIFAFWCTNKKCKMNLAAGISGEAMPLYNIMKFHVFVLPKLLRIYNTKPLLEKFGIKGVWLTAISAVFDFALRFYYLFTGHKTKKLRKQYLLEKVDLVPQWVDDIVMKDGKKYAEVHDHTWLQWNLDFNFKGHERDIQTFYVIKQNETPVGFVMTKERYRSEVQGLKNVMIGSIVEWGSVDENRLKEADLYRMVLNSFSKDVDIIETATNDVLTQRILKRLGFIHHGDAHVAFKDRTKQLTDSGDASLWRLRYGYADVILT